MPEDLDKPSFSVVPWVVVWMIYVLCYTLAKFYGITHVFFGGVVLSVNLILDGVMIFYACWLFQQSIAKTKLTFGLFLISFLCLFGHHAIYHVLYSILQIPRVQVTVFWLSAYNILYFGYLLFQMSAWIVILSSLKSGEKKSVFLYIPVAIIMLVTLCIYIFSVQWGSSASKLIGFYDGFDEIFELVGFITATICLVIAKNRGIAYLAFGYSIRIVAELALSFGLFSQAYGSGSIIETVWVLGIIFMIYGLFFIKRHGLYAHVDVDPWVELPVSIRSQVAYWGFISSVFAFVFFSVVVYLFGI